MTIPFQEQNQFISSPVHAYSPRFVFVSPLVWSCNIHLLITNHENILQKQNMSSEHSFFSNVFLIQRSPNMKLVHKKYCAFLKAM